MYSISINSVFRGGDTASSTPSAIKIIFLLDVSSIYTSFVFCLVLTLLFSPGTFFLVNASCLKVYESWDLENSDSQENMKLDKTILSFVSKRYTQFPRYLKQTNKKSSQKALQQAKNQRHLKVNVLESPGKFYDFSPSENNSPCLQFLKIRWI